MASVTVRNEDLVVPYGMAWELADEVEVAEQDVAYTDALDLSQAFYFGAWVRASGSSPNVKAEWQESPTLEEGDFVTVAEIHPGFGTTPAIAQIMPPPMRYGRVKLTGNVGNGSDTLATARVFIQGAAA